MLDKTKRTYKKPSKKIVEVTDVEANFNSGTDDEPTPPTAGGSQMNPEDNLDDFDESEVERREISPLPDDEDTIEQQELQAPEVDDENEVLASVIIAENDDAIEKLKDSVSTLNEVQSEEDNEKAKRFEKLRESTHPVASVPSKRTFGEPGVLTMVYSQRNGKRFAFILHVLKMLGDPSCLNVRINDEGILISAQHPEQDGGFPIKKQGQKGIIYSTGLAEEIKQRFNLDFTNRVSMTFHRIEYFTNEGQPSAFININD